MALFCYIVDCVIYTIKNKDQSINDQQIFDKFKERNLIVNEKFLEDIIDFYDVMEKYYEDHEEQEEPDRLLDNIGKLLKGNFPTPRPHMIVELRMIIFKMCLNILYNRYQPINVIDRKDLIDNILQLKDISSLVQKYDAYFKGNIIKDCTSNNKITTISTLLPNNRIIIGHEESNKLIIYNLKTYEIESALDVKHHYMQIISLGHDMILLKNFHNSTRVIWNIKTNKQEYFQGLKEHIPGEEILSDKLLITCGHSVKVWDLKTKELLDSFIPRKGSQVIKTIGDKVIFGLFDIEIWDLKTKKKECNLPAFSKKTHTTALMKLEKLKDDRLLSVDYENIRVFNLKDKKEEILYEGEEHITQSLLLDDETLLVTRMSNILELLNLKKKEIIFKTYLNIECVQYIKKLPGNEILFASKYGALCVWDLNTYISRYNFETYDKLCNLEISENGHIIMSLPGGIFKILS